MHLFIHSRYLLLKKNRSAILRILFGTQRNPAGPSLYVPRTLGANSLSIDYWHYVKGTTSYNSPQESLAGTLTWVRACIIFQLNTDLRKILYLKNSYRATSKGARRKKRKKMKINCRGVKQGQPLNWVTKCIIFKLKSILIQKNKNISNLNLERTMRTLATKWNLSLVSLSPLKLCCF